MDIKHELERLAAAPRMFGEVSPTIAEISKCALDRINELERVPEQGLKLIMRCDTGSLYDIELDGQHYGLTQIPFVQLLMLQKIEAMLRRKGAVNLGYFA